MARPGLAERAPLNIVMPTNGKEPPSMSQAPNLISQFIDRTEEHARAYAEALYDVAAITETERLTLLDDAREAAEARVREFRAAEQA